MTLKKNLIFFLYVIGLIILYFFFLIYTDVTPAGWQPPVIMLTGFALIILGFFYFIIFMTKDKSNKVILKIKLFNENTFIFILICLMLVTFFIPPITFSEMLIDWSQVSLMNYIRGIAFQ